MENPGVYTPIALGITTALTSQAQTAIDDLDGMEDITLIATFTYGSGGATCAGTIQVTPDDGVTWLDIARFNFTTATSTKWATISKRHDPTAAFAEISAAGVAAYVALSGEGINQGLVCGAKLRGVVTSTSTYANTTLTIRADVI